ncbi:MAG: 3-dehydroquinate synthase II [Candidatus Poseidonia sp.]|nr:3-dehydroquinate synthase II [Poseidonia sp.]
MEVWVDLRNGESSHRAEGVDRWLTPEAKGVNEIAVKGEELHDQTHCIGAHVIVKDASSQDLGRSLIGSVEWLLVECETWSMIPFENLVAARKGSPTKIAARIRSTHEAQGAGFALESGVDALVVDSSTELLEAALIIKAQRLEHAAEKVETQHESDSFELTPMRVTSVTDGGVGDRYCLDFTSLLNIGEGALVGSNSKALILVHGETIASNFVPTRPFRVNAGPPHSYIMMADGTTKYMSELQSGDELLIVDQEGVSRPVSLGRIKIETRPMLKVNFDTSTNMHAKAKEAHVFMQQAETVRLVSQLGKPCSVTEIKPGEFILGLHGDTGRHIGATITSQVEER